MSSTYNTLNTNKNNSIKNKINTFFFGSDFSVAFTIIFGLIIISITSIILFEKGIPNIRTQFSNNIIGIVGSLLFIYAIFKYMGSTTKIMDTELDTGLILYIIIIFLIIVLFSG